MKSLFFYSDSLAAFEFGPEHPFKPERAKRTYELCLRYGLLDPQAVEVIEPSPIDPSLLTSFHDSHYLRLLEEADSGEFSLEMLKYGIGTEDNPVIKGIYRWSLKAAGGTYQGMEAILGGRAWIAFNPLGGFHHARRAYAEGFCYINDIVVSLQKAVQKGKRVAFVDIDAHHCNGVQEAFYEDDSVLTLSIHESGSSLYPWSGGVEETGSGKGLGYNVNIPLPAGTDDEVFMAAFGQLVPPLLESFHPDLLVIELGADAMASDPMSHLRLTNNAYQEAVRRLREMKVPVLGLGGGGYDVSQTARCWTLAWAILNGLSPHDEFAGIVGGMMFGPETEAGTLCDEVRNNPGPEKDRSMEETNRVIDAVRAAVFPLQGIS